MIATLRGAVNLLIIGRNPIYVQYRRAKLRPGQRLSWGLITLTIAAFIFVLTYNTTAERGHADSTVAAKAALLPMIILQSVILMGLGTSSIATGIARERDKDLLDYHRLTPMSPAAKIVGYLFGLPSREYFLFLLTVPFVVYSVWVGQIPWGKVAQFYTVFFSSVWLYHLTGLMAGMVSRKPWQSSVFSLGAVAGLYLVLPQFAALGLSFFDFLTVRPTFYGMIREELVQYDAGAGFRAAFLTRQYQDVAFYELKLNPTVFSLVIQFMAMLTLYRVIRRKWIDPQAQPFSKRFAVLFMLGINLLLVGSLWPLLREGALLADLMKRMQGEGLPFVFGVLVSVFLLISGVAGLLALHLVTPTKVTVQRGLRRAARRGLPGIPWSWDAASSVPQLLAMLVISWLAFAAVLYAAVSGGQFFEPMAWSGLLAAWVQPIDGASQSMQFPLIWLLVIGVLGSLVAITFQSLNALLPIRTLVLVLFILWVMPLMVVIVDIAAFDRVIESMYLGVPCPFVGGALGVWSMIDQGRLELHGGQGNLFLDAELRPHAAAAVGATLLFYAGLALICSVMQAAQRRRLKRSEQMGAGQLPT